MRDASNDESFICVSHTYSVTTTQLRALKHNNVLHMKHSINVGKWNMCVLWEQGGYFAIVFKLVCS